VLCARWFGAGDRERLHRTVATALMVGLGGGALFGVLGILLARPLLRLVGSPAEVAPLAAVYLRLYFAGMPVIALYNFAGAALRSTGNTRQPLIYLAVRKKPFRAGTPK
jgi:Na+-driven multidrug efflux pump